MSDAAPSAIYLALALLLVGSSLVAMRLPLGKALRMALIWVAIFGAAFVVFAFRDDFTSLGQRLRAEATGVPIEHGEELRIPIAEDGHFWVEASVNGHEAAFLVDSGASITTLSRETAEAAEVAGSSRVAMIQTANGPVPMVQASIDRFELGPIERTDFPVNINQRDETNVLGMNFLSSLGSWRVEGNYLVLRP